MARFLRSSNVPESSLPPSPFPGEPQIAHQSPSSPSAGYPPRERMGPAVFHHHPGQPPYGPLASAHGVYAPLYDSRRVWRPQVEPSVHSIKCIFPVMNTFAYLHCSCTIERMPGVIRCLRRCCIPPSTSLHSGRDSTRSTATSALDPSTVRRCTGWVQMRMRIDMLEYHR